MVFLFRLRRSVSSLMARLDKDFRQAHVRAVARMEPSNQVMYVTSLVENVRKLETEIRLADGIWQELKKAVMALSEAASDALTEFERTRIFDSEKWQEIAGPLAEAENEMRRFKREFL